MVESDNSNWATLTLKEADRAEKKLLQYVLSPTVITIIGRSPDCQIALDSNQYMTVSRRHAQIQLVDSEWKISDLGTMNGTIVNDRPIQASHQLQSGDRIILGWKGPEFIFECLTLNATVMVEKTAVTPIEAQKLSQPAQTKSSTSSKFSEAIVTPLESDSLKTTSQLTSESKRTTFKATIPSKPVNLSSTSGKKLWHLLEIKELGQLSGHGDEIKALTFRPDGQILASASADKTIKLWDLTTSGEVSFLSGHKMAVNALAFSPDGQILASASADKTIKLWNLTTEEQTTSLSGHKMAVNALAFSPDGQILASASADKTIKLWQLATATEMISLATPSWIANPIALACNGEMFAGADENKTIRLWQI